MSSPSASESLWREPLLYRATVLTILVAGASLRLVGVGSMNLWVDEAVIANIAARGEMAEFLSYPGTNRPFGFLYLQHGLLSIHNSEWTVRLLAWLPSLASLPLFVLASRLLLHARAMQIAALVLFAANPWLIVYAKDFKAYSLESFFCLAMIVGVVGWERTHAPQYMRLFVGSSIGAVVFGLGGGMMAPVLAGALAWAQVNAGFSRQARSLGFLTFGLTGYLAFAAWLALRGSAADPAMVVYDDGFAPWANAVQVPLWAFVKMTEVLAQFSSLQSPFNIGGGAGLHRLVSVIAAGVGVAMLIREKRLISALALSAALLIPLVAALLGKWSFGVERINLFMISTVLLLVCSGLDALVRSRPAWLQWVVPGLLIALQIPVDTAAWTGKPAQYRAQREEIVDAMEVLRSRSPRGAPDETHISVNVLAIPAVNYYTRFHSAERQRLGGLFFGRRSFLPESGNQDRTYQAMRATFRRHGRVYFLLSHYAAEDLAALDQLVADGEAVERERLESPGVILALVEKADPEQPYR
jgi:hypothetical protein